jgi:hypothetical protein
MKGIYDMLDTLFQHGHKVDRKKETHFDPVEALFPRSSVHVEPSGVASWQVSFVERGISFG